MPPRWLRGDTKELYSSHSASPGSACGQVQVLADAGARIGRLCSRKGPPTERCILWGCLCEGHMRGEETEGQGLGILLFIFKLFNLRVGDGTTSLLQDEGCMLITACLSPVLAPEKTKQGSVSFLKGEKHTRKMQHCCVAW